MTNKDRRKFHLRKEIGTLEGLEAFVEILNLVLCLLALNLELFIEITPSSHQQGFLVSKLKYMTRMSGATRLRAVFVMQMPYVLTSANTSIVLETGITD